MAVTRSSITKFRIEKSKGNKSQVGLFIKSDHESTKRFCYYIWRRGFGGKTFPSKLEGYDWYTYVSYPGLKKEQIVAELMPHCKRITENIIIV